MDLFSEMDIKKIALVGPYLKETFDIEVNFLETNGFSVLCIKGPEKGLRTPAEYWAFQQDPYAVYRWVLNAASAAPEADCIFVTCMSSSILKVCQQLEEAIGKPVISSQSAAMHGILKFLRIPDPIPAYGQALTRSRF
jgi:maleate isomerase